MPRPSRSTPAVPSGVLDVQLIACAEITDDRPPRRGSTEGIASLAADIAQLGLSNPISVRRKPDGGYSVIAGGRRLAAYRLLKRPHIEARIFADDDLLADLRQRSENLQCQDLTTLEKALWLVQYEDQLQALGLRQQRGRPSKKPLPGSGFPVQSADIAAQAGLAESTARKYVALARALPSAIADDLLSTPVAEHMDQLEALVDPEAPALRRVKQSLHWLDFSALQRQLVDVLQQGQGLDLERAAERLMRRWNWCETCQAPIENQDPDKACQWPSWRYGYLWHCECGAHYLLEYKYAQAICSRCQAKHPPETQSSTPTSGSTATGQTPPTSPAPAAPDPLAELKTAVGVSKAASDLINRQRKLTRPAIANAQAQLAEVRAHLEAVVGSDRAALDQAAQINSAEATRWQELLDEVKRWLA